MKSSHIFFLSCFGGLAILAVILVQFFWIRAALDINETQFEQTVTIALRQVAEEINHENRHRFQHQNPVRKINSNNYAVEVNSEIDAELLNYYLIQKFDYFNIDHDIEYGIYDCETDQLIFCNYIKKGSTIGSYGWSELPTFEDLDYYFTVSFPKKTLLSMHGNPMWLVTSVILLIVIAFFIFALYVVFTQRSLSRVQRDFINNMTHEFKTPISTISVIQEVLSGLPEIKSNQRSSQYLGIIGKEADRLNEQVEKVLSITKVENRSFILKKEPVKAHEILEEVVKKAESAALANNSAIHHSFKAGNDRIEADALHFANIIHNLLDNAIKYSGKEKTIWVSTQSKGNKLSVKVKDNGPGIDKKEVRKIFTKFYRVHTGNVHNVKGFGIGLFYVKKVVDAHGWKILVHSEQQIGTEFTLIIPQKSK